MKQTLTVKLLLVLFTLTLVISKALNKKKPDPAIKLPKENTPCTIRWFVSGGWASNEFVIKEKRCDSLDECWKVEQSIGFDRKAFCNMEFRVEKTNNHPKHVLRYIPGLNQENKYWVSWMISYDDSTQIMEYVISYQTSEAHAWNKFRAIASNTPYPVKANQAHHQISAVKGYQEVFTNLLP